MVQPAVKTPALPAKSVNPLAMARRRFKFMAALVGLTGLAA